MRMKQLRWKGWNASLLMVYLIGICILWELEKTLNVPGAGKINDWVHVGELILLGAVLSKIRFRGDLWYWILAGGVLWIFISAALHSKKTLDKSEKYLMEAVLVYLLCPAVGLLVQGMSLRRFLKLFTAVWTAAFTALCLAGLYCVFRGIRVAEYSGKFFLGLDEVQLLTLFDDHYNITAAHLSASIMVALAGCALADRKWARIPYLVAAGIMFVALSLTGSRAGQFSACLGIGTAAVCALQNPLSGKIRQKWLWILLSLVLVLVIAVAGMLLLNGAQAGVNRVLNGQVPGDLMASAGAEGMEVTENQVSGVGQRAFFQSNFLSGREIVWREALTAFGSHPELWWTGTAIPTAMADIRAMSSIPKVSHFHNIFLQILIETGIPGLLLSLVFLFFVLRAVISLFLDLSRPLRDRFLILPVASILLIESVESVSRLAAKSYLNLIWMLFAGLVIVTAGRKPPAVPEEAGTTASPMLEEE